MKLVRALLLSVLLAVLVAACAAPSTSTTPAVTPDTASSGTGAAGSDTGPVGLATLQPGDLSLQTALLLGTLELEGTRQAVTPEQASQLLMLWKAVQSLAGSDTTSDVEMEALTHQIETTMTSEQLAAIAEMDLTQEDVRAVMQELGPSQTVMGDGPSTESGGMIFEGGPPGSAAGMAPPDGAVIQSGDQGASLTPEQLATLQAGRVSRGGAGLNLRLIQPLLDLLEERSKEV